MMAQLRIVLLGVVAFGVTGCRQATGLSAQAPAAAPVQATQSRTAEEREPEGRRTSRRGHGARTEAAPGQFDFYLLTLSWSPEYCETHASSPECGKGLGFVVHGLWPQNNDGTYPEDCSHAAGPANPGQYTNLLPTVSLVEHEWTTHGTCSGMGPDAYFQTVGKAFGEVKIPEAIGPAQTVAPNVLLEEFGAANPGFPAGSVVVSCGNNQLTAVEICLSKTLVAEACQNVKSCKAQVVKVTAR